jgi:hypothetical protein
MCYNREERENINTWERKREIWWRGEKKTSILRRERVMAKERESFGKGERVRTSLRCVAIGKRRKLTMARERKNFNMRGKESFNAREKKLQLWPRGEKENFSKKERKSDG